MLHGQFSEDSFVVELSDQRTYGGGERCIECIGQREPDLAGWRVVAWRQLEPNRLDVQLEVGEAVCELRESLLGQRSEAEALAAMAGGVDVGGQFGQAPRAAPGARRGARGGRGGAAGGQRQ